MADTVPIPSDVTAITIAGLDVDLDNVLYSLTYNHGRSDVADSASASTCSLQLQAKEGLVLPAAEVGDSLAVAVMGVAAFTGQVTDLALSHPAANVAQFDITATGVLAGLGVVPVVATAWPTETARNRAQRLAASLGVPTLVQGGATLSVVAMDGDTSDALTLLDDLATDTGAALTDTPDGGVQVQYLDARAIGGLFLLWRDAVGTWASFAGAWADAFAPKAPPLVLPAAAVAFEPQWTSRLGSVVNDVALTYGVKPDTGDQPTWEGDDAASIDLRGRRRYTASTQLADAASALWRGQLILNRQSQPRWSLGGVSVLMYLLDEWTRAAVVALRIGDRVALEQLPDPSPISPAFLIVEGWQDSHAAGSGYVRTFSLSDPRMSFAVLTWQALTTNPATWNDANGAWFDVVALTDLFPA